MKVISLLLLAAVTLTLAAPAQEPDCFWVLLDKDTDISKIQKPLEPNPSHSHDQSPAPAVTTPHAAAHSHAEEGDGEIPPGFLIEPKIGTTTKTPGGKILKERYGPFEVKPGSKAGQYTDVKSPCPDTGCFITAMESDLEYEDGTIANIDTGAWLHHMVIVSYGPNKEDLVCGEHPFGSLQPIFASGNERITARLNKVVPAGIRMNKDDTLALSTELMNEGADTKQLWLTVTFEYTSDESYKPAQLIWLDAAGCFGSDVPAQEGSYELHTQRWKSSINGRIITGGGHVHDGGESVIVYQNDKEVCVSEQLYGRTAAFREPDHGMSRRDGGHGHGGVKMQHISDSGRCDDFAHIKKGDILEAISYYNGTKYPQMVHDGEMHPVMGIMNMYVVEDDA